MFYGGPRENKYLGFFSEIIDRAERGQVFKIVPYFRVPKEDKYRGFFSNIFSGQQ